MKPREVKVRARKTGGALAKLWADCVHIAQAAFRLLADVAVRAARALAAAVEAFRARVRKVWRRCDLCTGFAFYRCYEERGKRGHGGTVGKWSVLCRDHGDGLAHEAWPGTRVELVVL